MKSDSYRLATKENRERLTLGLGWFSVGLGMTQLLAPRLLSRMIGVEPRPLLMRALGMRELATGIGILMQPERPGWLQARVAGDAMDLGLLGTAVASPGNGKIRLATSIAAVAGVAALDMLCSKDLSEGPGTRKDGQGSHQGVVHVAESIIVNAPPEQLYQKWRNFDELPRFMNHLISVQMEGDKRSHWVATGPAGSRVEWDAEIIEERPNELIAWRSLEGADVENAGSVRFERAPANRGTMVRVKLQYRTPAGRAGAKLAKLLGKSPEKQIKVDLRRFKQLVETGEIARTEGQPAGRERSMSMKYDDLVRA